MRAVPFLLVAAAALALPAPAAAKELTKAQVCGPSACVTVTDRDTLRAIPVGGESGAAQPSLQAFHTVRYTIEADGDRDAWTAYYVDRAAMMAWRNDGGLMTWSHVRGESATLMKKLARQVAPFRAPRVTGASVGGHPVADGPASYAALLEIRGERLVADATPVDWTPIDLQSTQPSPWTDAPFELMYSASTNALERGIHQVVIADEVAADIEAARPVGTGADGTRWLPWLVLGGLLSGLLLLAGLGALLRHRFGAAPAPEPAS